ncbi:MAG: hypothetical protein JXJ04_22315 [Spirochaetales bacterium]|nr:hypothetical protein [Spirochaetales bacterium]
MEIKCVHDFHFVMDKKMKTRLKRMEFHFKRKSFSGIVVKIIEVLFPVIRKEHKWGEQRMSRYKAVCDDPGEVREDIHVYFPGEVYRKLKLLHQDLNFYSIAQLLRELVEFFLGLVDVYGREVFRVLDRNFAGWRSEEEDTRLTSRKAIRQLFKIIRFLPGKERLITVYDNNFSPFWILRI